VKTKFAILITLFVILNSSYLILNCFAQWEPDVRLTNDSGTSYTSSNNAWCIAANGNVIHTVWYDDRDGNWEIYYKRSSDGGINWGADTRLTNNTAISCRPSIAVSGSFVNIVWADTCNGNWEIYYKRSSDGGINWGADTRLTYNTAYSYHPCIAVSGSFVHVVWYDNREGNWQVYYKRSTDGGINWGADIRLTNNTAVCSDPCIAVSGSFVHVVWLEYNGDYDIIYYKRSTDSGINWGVETPLTNNNDCSFEPSIAVSSLLVNLVWEDYGDGFNDVYYKRSTDGGINWGAETPLTNKNYWSFNPSIAVSGSFVNVVWNDDRDGNKEIYYKRSPIFQSPSNLAYDPINNRLFWTFSPSINVAKYLVYKKGSDNIWKSLADSGGMVNSNINYYNIQTSGYNYYRVAAISNIGDTAKSDSVYVNRGFVLRKLNSGSVESFKVNKHGFSFGNHDTLANGEPLMWNSFWYSQFNYQNSPYPYYFRIFSKSADYPDWPLFTNVYGRNKCYIYFYKPGNIIDSSFIRKSVAKWHNMTYYPIIPGVPKIETWRGTCFGFSIASLLAFYHNSAFYTQFPIMNNVDSTFGILPSGDVKKMINHLQTTQNFSKKIIPEDTINQKPNVILNLLETKFSKIATNGKLNGILGIIKTNGGGHAVVPYAIERINDSIKYLYIYDNECPSVDTARLKINTIANTCFYNMNDSTYSSMFIVDSLESCLGEQNFDNSYHKYIKNINFSNDSMLFYNSSNNTSLFLNQNGDTITGFRITDNTFLGNKRLGFSPMTDGRVNPPIYYRIPYSGYLKVILKDFIVSAGKSYLSFDLDSTTTFTIERTDSILSNQSDYYLIDSGYFSYINNNNIQKKINLLTIITENQGTPKEKSFNISNFNMILNDSVQIKRAIDNLVIKSKGTAKVYTLGLKLVDTSRNKTFYNPSVSLASNSTHIISPNWDSIKTRPVKIFVDLGNNGTVDDTLLISDTLLTPINNSNNNIPEKYAHEIRFRTG